MADQGKVILELLVKAQGLDKTAAQLKSMKGAIEQTTAASTKMTNVTKRQLEGTAKRSGSAGKDFSRQAQGMGGLVAAYATVAANVFALTSAFRVLKSAADFSSMIKSAENLQSVLGTNFKRIADDIQKATGGALNLAEALEAANRIAATGANPKQIRELTSIATKAAQTFGGTTTQAINRFIGAVQRGRTELVAQQGIVIKMDRVLNNYAADLGRSVKSLSEFERQQAITNAIIDEGNRLLGDVMIDPNPYETLGKAFQDLTRDILVFLEKGVDRIAIAFRDNAEAIIAFGVIIGRQILRKAIPVFSDMGAAALDTAARIEKAADAKRKSIKSVTAVLAAEAAKQRQIYNDQVIAATKAAVVRAKLVEKGKSSIFTSAKSGFAKEVETDQVDKEGKKLTKTVFDESAAKKASQQIGRTLKLSAKQMEGTVKGLSATLIETRKKEGDKVLINLQKNIDKQIAEHKRLAATAEKIESKSITAILARRNERVAERQLLTARLKAGAIGAFGEGSQSTFLDTGLMNKFRKATALSTNELENYTAAKQKLIKATKNVSFWFGTAVHSIGTFTSTLFSAFTAITLLITAYRVIASFLRDSTKAQDDYKESLKLTGEVIEDTTKKFADYQELVDRYSTDLAAGFIKGTTFAANALRDLQDSLSKTSAARRALVLDVGVKDFEGFSKRFNQLNSDLIKSKKELQAVLRTPAVNPEDQNAALDKAVEISNKYNKALKNLRNTTKLLFKNLGSELVNEIFIQIQAVDFATESGFGQNLKASIDKIVEGVEDSAVRDKLKDLRSSILADASAGVDIEDIIDKVKKNLKGLDDSLKLGLLDSLDKLRKGLNSGLVPIFEQETALKSMAGHADNFAKAMNDLNQAGVKNKSLLDAIQGFNSSLKVAVGNLDTAITKSKEFNAQLDAGETLSLGDVEIEDDLQQKTVALAGFFLQIPEAIKNSIPAVKELKAQLAAGKFEGFVDDTVIEATMARLIQIDLERREVIQRTNSLRILEQKETQKLLGINKAILTQQNKIIGSSKQAFEATKQIKEVEEAILQSKADEVAARARLQRSLIFEGQDPEQTRALKANIKLLEEQYKQYLEQIRILNPIYEGTLARLKAEQDILKIVQATNNALISNANAVKSALGGLQQSVAFQLDIFAAETKRIKLRKEDLLLQEKVLQAKQQEARRLGNDTKDLSLQNRLINDRLNSLDQVLLTRSIEAERARLVAEAEKATLEVTRERLEILKSSSEALAELSTNANQLALNQAQAAFQERESLQIKQDIVRQDIKILKARKLQLAAAVRLNKEELLALNNKIELERDRLYLLGQQAAIASRTNLIESARAGDTDFIIDLSDESIERFGMFFEDEMIQRVKSLNGPFELLARGFVNTMSEGISMIFQALVFSENKFKDVVNEIRKLLANVFANIAATQLERFIIAQLSKLKLFSFLKDDTATALDRLSTVMEGVSSSIDDLSASLGKATAPGPLATKDKPFVITDGAGVLSPEVKKQGQVLKDIKDIIDDSAAVEQARRNALTLKDAVLDIGDRIVTSIEAFSNSLHEGVAKLVAAVNNLCECKTVDTGATDTIVPIVVAAATADIDDSTLVKAIEKSSTEQVKATKAKAPVAVAHGPVIVPKQTPPIVNIPKQDIAPITVNVDKRPEFKPDELPKISIDPIDKIGIDISKPLPVEEIKIPKFPLLGIEVPNIDPVDIEYGTPPKIGFDPLKNLPSLEVESFPKLNVEPFTVPKVESPTIDPVKFEPFDFGPLPTFSVTIPDEAIPVEEVAPIPIDEIKAITADFGPVPTVDVKENITITMPEIPDFSNARVMYDGPEFIDVANIPEFTWPQIPEIKAPNLGTLEAPELGKLEAEKFPLLHTVELAKLETETFAKLEANAFDRLEVGQLPLLQIEEPPLLMASTLEKLEAHPFDKLQAESLDKLEVGELPLLQAVELAKLEAEQFATLRAEEFPLLAVEPLPLLKSAPLDLLQAAPFDKLEAEPLGKLKPEEFPLLTADKLPLLQVADLPLLEVGNLPLLETVELAKLDANPFDKLEAKTFDKLEVGYIPKLEAETFAKIEAEQFDKLKIETLPLLKTAPLPLLKAEPLETLKAAPMDKLEAVPFDQLTVNYGQIPTVKLEAFPDWKWPDFPDSPELIFPEITFPKFEWPPLPEFPTELKIEEAPTLKIDPITLPKIESPTFDRLEAEEFKFLKTEPLKDIDINYGQVPMLQSAPLDTLKAEPLKTYTLQVEEVAPLKVEETGPLEVDQPVSIQAPILQHQTSITADVPKSATEAEMLQTVKNIEEIARKSVTDTAGANVQNTIEEKAKRQEVKTTVKVDQTKPIVNVSPPMLPPLRLPKGPTDDRDVTFLDDINQRMGDLIGITKTLPTGIAEKNKINFDTLAGGLGNLLGGLVGSGGGFDLQSGLSTILKGSGNPYAMAGGYLLDLFGDGGITKQLRMFANGGLTNGPELAMVGEGPRREAVVPLPNNREIPVQFLDSEESRGDNVNITQSFDFRGADASAIGALRAEAKNIEERTFNRVFSEIGKGGRYAKQVGRR